MLDLFFVVLALTFVTSHSQQILPFGNFQTNVGLSGLTSGGLQTPALNNGQLGQLSFGFNLNPPTPLPYFHNFPLNSQFYSGSLPSSNNFLQNNFLVNAPTKPLFFPNVKPQRPQSDGQQEEYSKYLKEEAEYLEKEKSENDITTDFGLFDATTAQPKRKTFVRINVQGKDFSYTT